MDNTDWLAIEPEEGTATNVSKAPKINDLPPLITGVHNPLVHEGKVPTEGTKPLAPPIDNTVNTSNEKDWTYIEPESETKNIDNTEVSPSDLSITKSKHDAYPLLQMDKQELEGMFKIHPEMRSVYEHQLAGKEEDTKVGENLARLEQQTRNLGNIFSENKDARILLEDTMQKHDPSFKVFQPKDSSEWFYTSKNNTEPRPLNASLWQELKTNKDMIGLGLLAAVATPFILPAEAGTLLGSTALAVGRAGISAIGSGLGNVHDLEQNAKVTGVPSDNKFDAFATGAGMDLLGTGVSAGIKGTAALSELAGKYAKALVKDEPLPKFEPLKNGAQDFVQSNVDKALATLSTDEKVDRLELAKIAKDLGIEMPMGALDTKSTLAVIQKFAARNPLIREDLLAKLEKASVKVRQALGTSLRGVDTELAGKTHSEMQQTVTKNLKELQTYIKTPIQTEFNTLQEEGKNIPIANKHIEKYTSDLTNKLENVLKATEGSYEANSIVKPINTVLNSLKGGLDKTKLSYLTSETSIKHFSDLYNIPEELVSKVMTNLPKDVDSAYLKELGTNLIKNIDPFKARMDSTISKDAIDLTKYQNSLNKLGTRLAEESPSTVKASDLMDIQKYLSKKTGDRVKDLDNSKLKKEVSLLLEKSTLNHPSNFNTRLVQSNKDWADYASTMRADGDTANSVKADMETLLQRDKSGELSNYGAIDKLFTGIHGEVNARGIANKIKDLPKGREVLDQLGQLYFNKFIENVTKEFNPTVTLEQLSGVLKSGANQNTEHFNLNILKELQTPEKFAETKNYIRIAQGLSKDFDNIKNSTGMSAIDTKIIPTLFRMTLNALKYRLGTKYINENTMEEAIKANIEREIADNAMTTEQGRMIERALAESRNKIKSLEKTKKQLYTTSKLGSTNALKTIAIDKSEDKKADKSSSYNFINKGLKNDN